ncbi:MAG: hypothetical protein PVSMB10_05130 [Pseudarthrobacter sp.]
MDRNNVHVSGQPLADGFGQCGLAEARARHQEHGLTASGPDHVADPIQWLLPPSELAARFLW